MVVLGNERKYDCFVSILACFYYGLNPKYLGITKYRYSHALKTAKNLGYTALE